MFSNFQYMTRFESFAIRQERFKYLENITHRVVDATPDPFIGIRGETPPYNSEFTECMDL